MDKRYWLDWFLKTTLSYQFFHCQAFQPDIHNMYTNRVNLLLIMTAWTAHVHIGMLEWHNVQMETLFICSVLISVILHNCSILWYEFVRIKLKQLINSIINFCSTSVPIANWFKPTAVYSLLPSCSLDHDIHTVVTLLSTATVWSERTGAMAVLLTICLAERLPIVGTQWTLVE